MIHIYDELKEDISEELIAISGVLAAELKMLSLQGVPTAEEEFDLGRRWKNLNQRARGRLMAKLEQLSNPIIEGGVVLIDNAISNIKGQRMASEILKSIWYVGDPDYCVYQVNTNRGTIASGISFLSERRLELYKMRCSSLSEIFAFLKETQDKINEVDLKKFELAEIRKEVFESEQRRAFGEKSWTVNETELRKVYSLAKIGMQSQIMDEARALIREIKDQVAQNVTIGRVQKYEDLPKGSKEALDIIYEAK